MITDELKAQLIAHAAAAYPNECCGFVLIDHSERLQTFSCPNLYPDPTKGFEIAEMQLVEAQKLGKVVAVYHSHPDMESTLSEADIVASEELCLPYIAVSYPQEGISSYSPKGLSVELIGRPFHYGVWDCWTLVRDYYVMNLGITFPAAPVKDLGWWLDPQNESYYFDTLTKMMGFEVVPLLSSAEPVRKHDIILGQLASDTANHLMLYIGDGYIMHHVANRKSELAVYGGMWEKNTRYILRHPQAK